MARVHGKAVVALFKATLVTAARRPAVLLGAFLSPLLVLGAFALVDPSRLQEAPVRASYSGDLPSRLTELLRRSDDFSLRPFDSPETAVEELRTGRVEATILTAAQAVQVGIGVPPGTDVAYALDNTSIRQARIRDAIARVREPAAETSESAETEDRSTESPDPLLTDGIGGELAVIDIHGDADFLDFVFPGALLIGILTISLFVVPVAIGSYKERGILRRLLTTPISSADFVFADVGARTALGLLQMSVASVVGWTLLGVTRPSSFWLFFGVLLVALTTYLAAAYVLASMVRTSEGASTLASVVIVALILSSDTVFRLAQLSEALAHAMSFLPTAVHSEILRRLMLEGDPSIVSSSHMLLSMAWMTLALMGAVLGFRARA